MGYSERFGREIRARTEHRTKDSVWRSYVAQSESQQFPGPNRDSPPSGTRNSWCTLSIIPESSLVTTFRCDTYSSHTIRPPSLDRLRAQLEVLLDGLSRLDARTAGLQYGLDPSKLNMRHPELWKDLRSMLTEHQQEEELLKTKIYPASRSRSVSQDEEEAVAVCEALERSDKHGSGCPKAQQLGAQLEW